MSNEQKSLKTKVEFIINKFGYKTSYSENMLYAIEQVNKYHEKARYLIFGDYCVIKRYHEKSKNNGEWFKDLEWNLNELLGEYILNQNKNYFDE